ncbi:hypothetical protein HMPREF3216_00983 [Gardnerella vaginalis]|uniref:Uncharacterized protein n=1 Tax=Gardnerella vaginalis TaxID=2702 RepID=A0A133NNQ6_GARVA|nr:hypothetical protein HMPREF3216_00983 [Gardnerella vaginalis]
MPSLLVLLYLGEGIFAFDLYLICICCDTPRLHVFALCCKVDICCVKRRSKYK